MDATIVNLQCSSQIRCNDAKPRMRKVGEVPRKKEKKKSCDEPHWSKVLQTGQVGEHSPPKSKNSNSLFDKFLHWLRPQQPAMEHLSPGPKDRSLSTPSPMVSKFSIVSISSSPSPIEEYDRSPSCSISSAHRKPSITRTSIERSPPSYFPPSRQHHSSNIPKKSSPCLIGYDVKQTRVSGTLEENNNPSKKLVLQEPSSSTILRKRSLKRLHQVHKPVAIHPIEPTHTLDKLSDNCISGVRPRKVTMEPAVSSPRDVRRTKENLGVVKSPLTSTISCPSKPQFLRQSSLMEYRKSRLTASWPPIGYQLFSDSSDDSDEETENNQSERGIKHLQEFTISFEDIAIGSCLSSTSTVQLYHGRWHGNVIVQIYKDECSTRFWEDVSRLSRIRHENIALFMGACTEAGHLAVVTSECIGVSLYEKLHIKRHRLTLPLRLYFIDQLVQGMAYLHAKNIIYGLCSAQNLFVHNAKIKLSIVDYGSTGASLSPAGMLTNSRSNLIYIAPEILPSPEHDRTKSCCDMLKTIHSDVYALGTVMYEIISMRVPYENIPVSALRNQICAGRRPPLSNLPAPELLKELIENCWDHLPHLRPSCHKIVRVITKNKVSINKRLSSSEPEKINKTTSNPFT